MPNLPSKEQDENALNSNSLHWKVGCNNAANVSTTSKTVGENVETKDNAPSSSKSIDLYPPSTADSLLTGSQPPDSQNAKNIGQAYTAEDFAKLGIKVRDFAYESTLPPISSVPYFAGGSRPLKRERETFEDEDDRLAPSTPATAIKDIFAPAVSKRAKALSRELTEPLDPQPALSQTSLTRNPGFLEIQTSLSNRVPDHNRGVSQPPSPHEPTFSLDAVTRASSAAPSWPSASQQQPDLPSQDTDTWIDTPLVTPHGSRQWEFTNTSAIPASQLDTELQLPEPENVTLSQLGFSQDLYQYSQSEPNASPPAPSTLSNIAGPSSPLQPRATKAIHAQESSLQAAFELTYTQVRYNFRERANHSTASAPTEDSGPRHHSISRDKRSASHSPRRRSPRIRSPRSRGDRTSQSVLPLRRSARHAQKPPDGSMK